MEKYPVQLERDAEQQGAVLRGRTRVHEGLGHNGEASVRDAALVNIKNKLWVLDDIHPKPQGQTGIEKEIRGVSNIRITNLSPLCLFIQEVKHVFDGQGKGTGPVCCAEHCLKQIINKLLQRTLEKTNTSGIYPLRNLCSRKVNQLVNIFSATDSVLEQEKDRGVLLVTVRWRKSPMPAVVFCEKEEKHLDVSTLLTSRLKLVF
ncbi:hypothetical protein E2320_016469 [Naja naja]|nr:hypothetical protein E2320_016469 [Naja naja]